MTFKELQDFVDALDYALPSTAEIEFIQYDASDEKVIVDYINSLDEEIRYTYSLK